jgi:Double-GTPase 2
LLNVMKTIQPMDSYRLAQYSVPMPCYICGEGNTFDSDRCRHCSAPMALARQAAAQKIQPRMIGVLGAGGAGKTVYLGMLLDMLSRLPERLQVLARGAFSITVQQNVVGALVQRDFPPKTSSEPESWDWVHCQIQSAARKPPLELIMPDIAGDAVLEEMNHPHTYPAVHSFLGQCTAAIVLLDAVELDAGETRQEYFALKLLSYLNEIDQAAGHAWRDRPLAFVLSKADRCETCFEDPAEFVRARAASLWQLCAERFNQHRFFAAGVAGACAACMVRGVGRVIVPLRIEPRGIIEPFEWLVRRLKN